ncbi:MAG: response regulator [Bacillota bacterium]
MNTILIVDQSNIMRLKIRSIISSPEINILESNNVEDVKNNDFADDYLLEDIDLLILDIQFGDKQDFSLLSYLKKEDFQFPVIILTSNDRRGSVLKAYRFGVSDYLLKPFDRQILESKINYYLKEEEQKQLVKYGDENNDIEYFKLDLLQELSRASRGGEEFSILRIEVQQDEALINIKELLLSLMRGIDKIYEIAEKDLILLAPLTNQVGAEKLFERLNSYLSEHLEEIRVNLKSVISFPKDITETVERDQVVEYQHQILKEIFKEK